MRGYVARITVTLTLPAFNSLFEMHIPQRIDHAGGDVGELSILYLRCTDVESYVTECP